MQQIIENFKDFRKSLKSPSTFENLHLNSRQLSPTQQFIQGVKFDLNSQHNQNFQTSHSFGWDELGTYNFGAVFANNDVIMHGSIDNTNTLQMRGHYNWNPKNVSKVQAQLSTRVGMSAVHLEHEMLGSDYSVGLKMVNPNPFDAIIDGKPSLTGVFSISYMQSVTKHLALGLEHTIQKPYPNSNERSTAFGLRYANYGELPLPLSLPPGAQSPYMPINAEDPIDLFTITWQPASNILHTSYWKRLNQRLEVGCDLQMLLTPSTKEMGRRDGKIINSGSECWVQVGYCVCYYQELFRE